jgi:hypothetical protein
MVDRSASGARRRVGSVSSIPTRCSKVCTTASVSSASVSSANTVSACRASTPATPPNTRYNAWLAALKRFPVAPGTGMPRNPRRSREYLETAEQGTTAITLAYDGFTTYEGQHTDAVFIEAHHLNLDRTVIAQRYVRTNGGVESLGDPMLQAEVAPLALGVRGV